MNGDVIETIKISDTIRAEIIEDENPESPREWDNLGVMICFHRRYNLGDKSVIKINFEDFDGWDALEEYLATTLEASVILPLYLMDHSGISISTKSFNDAWDSGQVGFIYVTKKGILQEFGKKILTLSLKDKAKEILEQEVKTYNQFLTGEVYGFQVIKTEICDKCHEPHEEVIESCGGFFGLEATKNELEDVLKKIKEEEE